MTKDSGKVRTEGRTLHVGRRTATAEARITDTKGRLLAHATTTCLVFESPKGSRKAKPNGGVSRSHWSHERRRWISAGHRA